MKIGVLGSGSWGTALSQVLVDGGHDVLIYGVEKAELDDINLNHKNEKYFPHVLINEKIKASGDIRALASYNDAIIVAVPTRFISDVLSQIKPFIKESTIIINASKGFEWGTNKRISVCIRDALDGTSYAGIASIIGPSHAEEVILRKLTSVCAVSVSYEIAEEVQRIFSNSYLRVYVSTDEVGAEYGVAIKNIIAIASGMLEGQGYGDNSKAALITRGLQEMIRYGESKGAKSSTFIGLTGVGDLIVTCFSPHSRNYRAGLEIGRADSAEVLENNHTTVEGVHSCKSVFEDAEKNNIEMPIVSSVYRVLFCNAKPSDEIALLMNRPLKAEM